ncbi:MAG: metallophosphoesterase [Edaphobacter sp.]
MDTLVSPSAVSRRRFLRQSLAFSALATLGSLPGLAAPLLSDPGAAELLMVGDWGYDDDHTAQSGVAVGMRQYAQQRGPKTQALLMLGDNWYGELAGGVHSPRWQTQFEEMYPADVFACPAYAIPGNHDYQRWPESKVAAELEYARVGKTSAGPTRWTMPSLWYRFEFPAKKPLITFIALDSNMPFADGSPSRGRDFTLTPQQQTEQLAWLETELKRPRTTRFLVVMGHHPVYSDGQHGDHPVLVRDWDPLFRKHKVDLYLAGHDHDLQHLEFEGHPTSFFLSGGGGADLYNLKIDPSQRGPYAQKVYGFSHLSVTEKQMTLRHLDSNGRILHAFTKTSEGRIEIVTV